MYILRCGIRISFICSHPGCAWPLERCGKWAGRERLTAPGQSTRRNPQVDERRAHQKRVRRVASAHEAKIHLRQYTLSDSCFRLRNLDRNCRCCSVRWSFGRSAVADLRMEHSSQSKDRWKNRRQCCAGPPVRSLYTGGAPCIDGRGRAKLLLFLSDIHCAECAARAHVRIHGVMGWLESRCSHPISPPSRAVVLA